jgi:cytochrome c oxidase subunit 3
MGVLLVPILMLFLAFASAYIVRQGMGEGWFAVPLPSLLWANTFVLLASGIALEVARRATLRSAPRAQLPMRVPREATAQHGLWAAFALGTLFLVGQWFAWRQLQANGIDISTSPHSSFFYVLTIAHAVHVAAGILGLLAAATWPAAGRWSLGRADSTRLAAMYWHFMGALWMGIVLLLVLGR